MIGTLATQAAAADIDTLISTGDKDLTQLVGRKIRWYNTMSNELLDVAGVTAKFGVPPERIIDYLALVGDAVDGVPGVAKCGPKTAVKWLTQYGTLDNLVANADAVSGVVGQNLRDHLAFLPLGKKLVTVVCDLPDLPAPTALHRHTAGHPDTARAVQALPVPLPGSMKSTARTRPPASRRKRSASPMTIRRRPEAGGELRNRADLAAVRRLAGQDRGRRVHRRWTPRRPAWIPSKRASSAFRCR